MHLEYPIVNKIRLVRCTKKRPCPICRKKDWCSFSSDGSFVLCMRESQGAVKQAANGAFVHIVNPTEPVKPYIVETKVEEIRDYPNIHRIYSTLIRQMLDLNPAHYQHLIMYRGLSDQSITRNGYASFPPASHYPRLLEKIVQKFGNRLLGVPGFFRHVEKGKWSMLRYDGFLLPARDFNGQIRGMQVRKDSGFPKYVWFSTPPESFIDGTSCGSKLHFSNYGNEKAQQVIITEGVLKADCISEFTGEAVVGMPGVNTVRPITLVRELKAGFYKLQKVIIAFDMDWKINKAVQFAISKLASELEKHYEVRIRTWDIELAKGYDDVLHKYHDTRTIDYTPLDFTNILPKIDF